MGFQRVLGIHIIVVTNIFLSAGLVVTYAISVAKGHVNPLWCYISYTGDYPVESCIFSAVMNLVSAAYFLIVYLRYAQLSAVISDQDLPEKTIGRLRLCNLTSLFFGSSGTFGLSMAGCFQHRLFNLMHLGGVFLATYFTLVYVILQTYLTFALTSLSSVFTKRLRLALATLSSFVLSSGPGFFLYFLLCRTQEFEAVEMHREIQRGDAADKAGAALEWILFLLYHLFVYSFSPDFKRIALENDQIVFL